MGNPAGVWRHTDCGKLQFWAPGYAVYGYMEEREGKWFWEARTMENTRTSIHPPTGYATSPSGAKAIIETLLKETNTCDFNN